MDTVGQNWSEGVDYSFYNTHMLSGVSRRVTVRAWCCWGGVKGCGGLLVELDRAHGLSGDVKHTWREMTGRSGMSETKRGRAWV